MAVIAGLIALVAIVYFATSNDNDSVKEAGVENTQNNNSAPVGGDRFDGTGASASVNSVTLKPTETGNFASVQRATLTKPGFVVVYRVNSNSETEVVGSSELLLPGTYGDIAIQLDSVIASNQTVVAVLHEDDGDGEFKLPNTDLYLGNVGQPIVSDVDVVGVSAEKEDAVLQNQVEAYLEKNLTTSTTVTP